MWWPYTVHSVLYSCGVFPKEALPLNDIVSHETSILFIFLCSEYYFSDENLQKDFFLRGQVSFLGGLI